MTATILEYWKTEEPFASVVGSVAGVACCGPRKLWWLHELCRGVPSGECAEIGVYRGGSALVMATCFPAKTWHLFDTFVGMPAVDATIDKHHAGDFGNTSLEEVRQRLSGCRNVRLYPGMFPATASPVAGHRFSFVHVDVDIYRSVRDCCEFFYSRLVPGGVMVSDDYGHLSCPGAKKAFDEFFSGRETIIRTDFGTSYIVKANYTAGSESAAARAEIVRWINPGMNGLDIGSGGAPIFPQAISLDQHGRGIFSDLVQVRGDASCLQWFVSGSLDYVFSSHCLEDFPPERIASVLAEWVRVIKPGGLLVLLLPDEVKYSEVCRRTGQPHNPSHKDPEFGLATVRRVMPAGMVEIHSQDIGAYSFLVVCRKA